MNSLPSIDSSDSRPQNGFKLHVSNLPLTVQPEDLQGVFQRFGTIEDIKIIRKNANGMPLRGYYYGFVIFTSETDAMNALNTLNSEGWRINLSKEARQIQAQREVKLPIHAIPSPVSFSFNAQSTHLMLLNNPKTKIMNSIDWKLVDKLIQDHHPNASNMSEVPPPYNSFLLVREIWVGNLSSTTELRSLYDGFNRYGVIEGIEMFSSKGFAFVKYRKIVQATLAYELAQGEMVGNRSVKVAFADPTRRIDIVGNASGDHDPGFNPIDDSNFKTLYLGYTNKSHVPNEQKLREVFSRYGIVKGIHVKQAQDNIRPYAFVDFESGEQAGAARRCLYIDDADGQRRAELGDPNLEISLKNINTIVSRNGVKNGVRFPVQQNSDEIQEVTKRLMQHTPESLSQLDFPIYPPQNFLGFVPQTIQSPPIQPAPQPQVIPQTRQANEDNVIWAGFMTRSKKYKVGIDAILVNGNADFLLNSYHLNITHRAKLEDPFQQEVLGIVTLEASDDMQFVEFRKYIAYFAKKKRGGFIPLRNRDVVMYVLPPVESVKERCQKVKDNQMLGLFVEQKVK